MADTLAELHAMAAQLGIPPRAFQNKASGAHYDVTAELRAQALALGAVAISRHVDRAQVKAVIANARAQSQPWAGTGGTGPRPASAQGGGKPPGMARRYQ